jgi:hypothetical protein
MGKPWSYRNHLLFYNLATATPQHHKHHQPQWVRKLPLVTETVESTFIPFNSVARCMGPEVFASKSKTGGVCGVVV